MKLNELNEMETMPDILSSGTIQVEQKEGIKLTRNASGIYQWEIKTLDIDVGRIVKIDEDIRKELDSQNLKYTKEEKK